MTKSVQGAYIYVSLNVYLSIYNSIFDYGLASQGGAIYINGLSNVIINYATFTNNYASDSGGAIYSTGYQYVAINNTIFIDNYAFSKGSEYYALFSNYVTYVSNVTVTNPAPVSSFYCDTISLSTSYLIITAGTTTTSSTAQYGGGITCLNCGTMVIDKSTFSGLLASDGGAIYIEQADSAKNGTKYPTYNVIYLIFYSIYS